MTFPQEKKQPPKSINAGPDLTGRVQLSTPTPLDALKQEQAQRANEQNAAWYQNPPPGYGIQPPDPRQIPNYDKLTGFERLVSNAIPNVKLPDWATSGPIGKTFAFAGHALSLLAVPAGAIERTIGLATQGLAAIGDPNSDYQKNFTAAWYASSMAYDVANLPILSLDPNKPGFYMPQDLPGVDGLVKVRGRIAELVGQGASYHDATIQAKGELDQSLGALAIRSALNDLAGNLILDPLMYVDQIAKIPGFNKLLLPVERAKAYGAIVAGKTTAEGVAESAKAAEVAGVSLKTAEDAVKAAETAGDAAKLSEAQKVLATAKIAGDNAALLHTEALANQMSHTEQMAYRAMQALVGYDPLNPKKANRLLDFFRWTQDTKARELVSNTDNWLQSAAVNWNDPVSTFRNLERASDGMLTPEMARALVSEQGRVMHGLLPQMKDALAPMAEVFQKSGPDREILNRVAMLLGTDAGKIASRAKDGEGLALVNQVMQRLGANPELAKSMETMFAAAGRQLTPDSLKASLEVWGNTHFYDPQWVNAAMLDSSKDIAMRYGIAKFGVQERGFWQSAARAVKSVENAVFLRLATPAFPLRNIGNNIPVMLRDGLYGFMSSGDAAKFVESFGIAPARFAEGYGIAGAAAEDLSKMGLAERTLGEALKNTGSGKFFEQFASAVNGANLPYDMARLSGKLETMSSQIASATAFKRFWHEHLPSFLVPVAEGAPLAHTEMGAEASTALMRALSGAKTNAEIDSILQGDNVRLVAGNIVRSLEQKTGMPINQIFGEDLTDHIMSGLSAAAKNGTTDEFLSGIRSTVSQSLETAKNARLEDITAWTAARAQTEGPRAFVDEFQNAVGEMRQWRISHANDMQGFAEEVHSLERGGATQALIDQKWRTKLLSEQGFADRQWSIMEARINGLEQGAKAWGGKGITADFKDWRNGWKSFFDYKQTAMSEFQTTKFKSYEERLAAYDAMEIDLANKYADGIQLERKSLERMDAKMGAMLPPEQKPYFDAFRKRVNDLNEVSNQNLLEFRRSLIGKPSADRWRAHQAFVVDHTRTLKQIQEQVDLGWAAVQGNQKARAVLSTEAEQFAARTAIAESALTKRSAGAALTPEETSALRDMVQKFATKTEERQLRKLAAEMQADPELATARQSDMVLLESNILDRVKNRSAQTTFLPSLEAAGVSAPHPLAEGLNWLWHSHGEDLLTLLGDTAKAEAGKAPLAVGTLSDGAKTQLLDYAEKTKASLAQAKNAGITFAESMRDGALLNYNRRYGFDNFMNLLAPFAYWPMHTSFAWALNSLDRPGMLASYIKLQQFADKAGKYVNQEIGPTRLRGKIKFNLPFAPKWMGDQYIDPFAMFLPFKQWVSPFEDLARQESGDVGYAERVMTQLHDDKNITDAEYQSGLSHSGPVWDRAVGLAQQDDQSGRQSAMDTLSSLTALHAPLQWAYNAATGHPEKNSAVLPITRSLGGAAAALGFDPASVFNPEAYLRVHLLHLPAFDKFDDYRAQRELTTMLAESQITYAQFTQAFTNKEDPLYKQAFTRSVARGAGGNAAGFAVNFLGIRADSYPPGEEYLRRLDGAMQDLYAEKDAAKSPEGVKVATDKINAFYEQHPEYSARRALFKTPDEQIRQFTQDALWQRYTSLPIIDQQAAKTSLGPLFTDGFVSKDTRNYDSISTDMMVTWLKLLGGTPPGSLDGKQDVPPIKFAPPAVAAVADQYYAYRNAMWPNYSEQAQIFFSLDPKAQKRYKNEHPDFAIALNWRTDFLLRNPNVVPYLSDKNPPKYKSEQAALAAQQNQPNLSAQEWQMTIGIPAYRLVLDNAPLSAAMRAKLKQVADQYGWQGTVEELAADIRGAQ